MLRDMKHSNTQKVVPERLSRPGKSRSICLRQIKLIDYNDPGIIKHRPNHAHKQVL